MRRREPRLTIRNPESSVPVRIAVRREQAILVCQLVRHTLRFRGKVGTLDRAVARSSILPRPEVLNYQKPCRTAI